jgi:hypothetical protein
MIGFLGFSVMVSRFGGRGCVHTLYPQTRGHTTADPKELNDTKSCKVIDFLQKMVYIKNVLINLCALY